MKTHTDGAVPIMNQYDTCQMVPCLLGNFLGGIFISIQQFLLVTGHAEVVTFSVTILAQMMHTQYFYLFI